MENHHFKFISPDASPEQIEDIQRRQAAGLVGCICKIGDGPVGNRSERIYGRFQFLRRWFRALQTLGE